MFVNAGFQALRSDGLYDRIMAERHLRMVDSAARCLARELNTDGYPASRSELARRAGVDHWSEATLDEAIVAAERSGLLRSLPMGWVAPAEPLGGATSQRTLGVHPRPTRPRGRKSG